MSRIQLALNVSDIDAAIAFYTKLFGTEPAKVRPGYANFAVADPPLKLVLIEGQAAPGTLNHLGVEVGSTAEVAAAQGRLAGAGLATATEEAVTCCYALQDKVWVDGPDAEPWEIYTVLADAEMPDGSLRAPVATDCGPGACCSASPAAEAAACCDPPAGDAAEGSAKPTTEGADGRATGTPAVADAGATGTTEAAEGSAKPTTEAADGSAGATEAGACFAPAAGVATV